ncbi:hypothetical protein VTO73DRAFT_13579 [Trametes versicolor]
MNHKAIVLWDPKKNTKLASDDACTTIIQYELPRAPSTIRPPYQSPHPPDVRLRYVPPLAYFCIKALAEYPDEMHSLGAARLRYEAPWSRSQFDILSALIPSYRPFDEAESDEDFDLSPVDPRLWAVIVQVYEGLPDDFRHYTIPLSDAYLPLLQTIPSTKHFSLITALSLGRCKVLTDDTIIQLCQLHTLAALDASATAVGTWGISRLSKSLNWSEADATHPAQRRGPWGLRILYLRDCINVDNKILPLLAHFPLLSVVDLRGTICQPWRDPNLPFKACTDTTLFHPSSLTSVLYRWAESTDGQHRSIFSHPKPFVLDVHKLHHTAAPVHPNKYALNDLYRDTDDDDHRPMEFIGRRRDVFLPYEPAREETPSEDEETFDTILAARPPSPAYDDDGADNGNSEADLSDGESAYSAGSVVSASHPWYADTRPQVEGPAPRPPIAEPQPEEDNSWMTEVAEDEVREYMTGRDVDAFYKQNPNASRDTFLLRRIPSLKPQPQGLADQLMLFRPPPPWSTLPSAPPVKPASKSSTSTLHGMPDSAFASGSGHGHGPKRKRSGLDDAAPAQTDQARRKMHALSRIQGLVNMVQSRGDGSKGKGKAGGGTQVRMVMPGRVNPFARTAQAERQKEAALTSKPTLKRKATETSPERAPVVGREGPRDAEPRRSASNLVPQNAIPTAGPSKSKPTVTPQAAPPTPKVGAPAHADHSTAVAGTPAEGPRPSKKLKPITSLPVPDWPNAGHKPVSHHAPKPKPPPPKAEVQTKLPVSRSSAKPPDIAKEKRRVSTSVATTPRLQMVAEAKISAVTKGKTDNAPSKGGKGKEREKKGAGFDWKSWGK